MKWRTETRSFNDRHWRRVFAWTPKRCTDGYTRWFAFVARSVRFVGYAPIFVYRPIFKEKHHGN